MHLPPIQQHTARALYSIEVYDTHAIISGWLTADILSLLVKLCKKHGFTHLTHNDGNPGFKLVRKDDS